MNFRFTPIAFLVLAASAAGAADDTTALKERFSERLKAVLPDTKIAAVKPTPIPGLYEVVLGAQVLYMTEDGRYIVKGDVYDLDAKRNLSEDSRAQARLDAFEAMGTDTMIQFAPEGTPKHVMYVFTDVECGYCRKLHAEVNKLTAAGVAVRYLAYPRAGIPSPDYETMVSIWCAPDRNKALTAAKAGQEVKKATCENPVSEHYALGNALGVRGTPTIVLENGRELGGYAPAEQIVQMLESGS